VILDSWQQALGYICANENQDTNEDWSREQNHKNGKEQRAS
jgi:hypothetical protein